MDRKRYKHLLVGLGGASACLVFAPGALAVPVISVDVDYSLGNGPTESATPYINTATHKDALGTAENYFSGDNVFYHTYGDTGGNFGSRVSGGGEFDITGRFVYEDTLVNTSAFNRQYAFDFTVTAGELAASVANTGDASQIARAEYLIDILVDTGSGYSSVWQSGAYLQLDGTGLETFVETGQSLEGNRSTYNEYSDYRWGDRSLSAVLGTLGSSESMHFIYELTTIAWSNTSLSDMDINSCEPINDVEGFEFVRDVGEGGDINSWSNNRCIGNSAIARSGDPFFFYDLPVQDFQMANRFSVSSQQVDAAAVPEPGSLALMGLGVAGLIGNMRRKKKV